MSARTSAATERALRAIKNGANPHEAAIKYRLSPSTIYRALKKIREKNNLTNQQVENTDLTVVKNPENSN